MNTFRIRRPFEKQYFLVGEIVLIAIQCISFTSNGAVGSVTEGNGDPLGPVANPKGGGIRYPREAK